MRRVRLMYIGNAVLWVLAIVLLWRGAMEWYDRTHDPGNHREHSTRSPTQSYPKIQTLIALGGTEDGDEKVIRTSIGALRLGSVPILEGITGRARSNANRFQAIPPSSPVAVAGVDALCGARIVCLAVIDGNQLYVQMVLESDGTVRGAQMTCP